MNMHKLELERTEVCDAVGEGVRRGQVKTGSKQNRSIPS